VTGHSGTSGAERDRPWSLMTAVWPNYDQDKERTTRQIPIVVLERAQGA
jgi:hypothetical protein